MIKNVPLISVLVCNYNYGKYIQESLDSILQQDYRPLEVIVIDDGSTDDSVAIIKKCIKDHPEFAIHLKAKKKNEGLCYARNDAINLAKGEYFLFLDSDDTMPPDYISTLYRFAIEEGADVVYGDVRMFGDETGESSSPEYDSEKLLLDNYIDISTLVKKSKIANHRFDINLNRKTLEDYDFWLGLSLMGLKFVKAHGAYLNYRIQKQSRNENALSLEARIINFVNAWKYSVDKYKERYPQKIKDDILLDEVKHQVNKIGQELGRLNKVVHRELVPELKKREGHINRQEQKIQDLEKTVQRLQENQKALIKSKDYQIGHIVMTPARAIKKVMGSGPSPQ